MAKDPAFLFYPADFLVGTLLMTFDQRGKYVTLMCLQQQTGHLCEEDMLKICGTYDKDIFDKFTKDDDGKFYNQRMEEEINKRSSFANSRRNNRLGVKNGKKLESSDKHVTQQVLNTSKSHDRHMENENTTTITVSNMDSNKGKEDNIILNTNSSGSGTSVEQVSNISSTHDKDMLISGYGGEIYRLSAGNADLAHPIDVCLWNYFNNKDYEQARGLHCIRLNLDPDPQKCMDRLPEWAAAFNRALVNDGKLTISMSGGRECWLQYFPNWAKKMIEIGKTNPAIIFTAKEIKKSQNGANHKVMSGDAPIEDQLAHYKPRKRHQD